MSLSWDLTLAAFCGGAFGSLLAQIYFDWRNRREEEEYEEEDVEDETAP